MRAFGAARLGRDGLARPAWNSKSPPRERAFSPWPVASVMPDDQRRREQRPERGPKEPRKRRAGVRRGHLAAVPDGGGASRLRLNKLRLGLTLFLLSILAVVSTVFGMMMAVAQDLPKLESQNEFKAAKNSVLLDASGKHQLAVLTGESNRILVRSGFISSDVKKAVIAIEDRRFYKHKGVDYRGIARALWADVRRRRAVQGASTITQQFVKNALLAQQNRSIFQKLREAALAYQLERKWTKDKILTEYLNTVYFGSGAYGIESAARVYFAWNHPGCQPHCAAVLEPAEAALLAGMIASPTAYSPVDNPAAALQRRDLVLQNMRDTYALAPSEYETAVREALPPRNRIEPPRKVSKAPYFSSWVEDHLVNRYGTGNTFGGGLKIRTTLDLEFQAAAEQAINGRLVRRGAERGAGRDRQQDRRSAGDGGGRGLPGAAVQPRHPGPATARLGVQAVHPDRGPREGHLARSHLHLGAEGAGGSARRVQGRELQRQLRRRDDPGWGDGDVRQLGVRRGRLPARGHALGRPRRAPHGCADADLEEPGDGARRPEGGRDAGRDGEGLRDARRIGARA